MPYSATEGTQLVFTLLYDGGWFDNREGNTESEYKIQIQYPESIQDSYEYVQSDWNNDDVDNPVEMNGTLSFIMPAENVTLNIDLVENPDYIAPPVETELTVVNNLPNNYRLGVKYRDVNNMEEPESIDDISSPVVIPEGSMIYVYVYDENNNLVNMSPTDSTDYSTSHADAQAMVDYHAYCTIEVDETDTYTLTTYTVMNQLDSEADYNAGERFQIGSNINLTVAVPTVN